LKSLLGTREYKWIALLTLLLFSTGVQAQSRKELEKKRNNLQQEIKQASALLDKTTKTQKSEYQRFQVLQTQVQKREELIQTIRRELRLVDKQIETNKSETQKLEKEIEKLYAEYAAILQKVFRIQATTDKLLLMLSAKNINQALQRWTYVNQIKKVRKEQADELNKKRIVLAEKQKQLENFRKEKEKLLQAEEKEKGQLAGEMEEKNKLIQSLKKDESRIRKQIQDKEIASEKLNIEIQKIIALEIEKQRKEAEARAAAEREKERKRKEEEARAAADAKKKGDEKKPGPSGIEAEKENKPIPASPKNPTKPASLPETPEIKALSESFASNKGKLPWPVQKGSISRKFGTQPHPIIQTLTITNNGINIRTEKGSSVRAVFKGEVVGKRYVPGHNYLVMVQHGNYYTIYSNLDEVFVKEGQKINTGEVLGKALGEEDDVFSEIHFEIWQDKKLQDPSLWLKS
jgi:septal ring factor EnvC (AmiA/AmiB activator)